MIKTATIFAVMFMALHSISATAATLGANPSREAQNYVISKLHAHDIVFLGTTHRQPAILGLVAELLPLLTRAGVTHLALEIGSDQQTRLDYYLASGKGLMQIDLAPAIDCSQYRRLLKTLRQMPSAARPRIVALDLPASRYGGPDSRDHWMATGLNQILQAPERVKILVMLGSLHILHKLEWQSRLGKGQDSIRTYLGRVRPHLRMFSIVNIVSGKEGDCDFGRVLGPLPGIVAVDLDRRFEGWTLGLTRCIALRPAQPYELVDGVIVY